MSFLQMSLHGGVMILAVVVIRALTVNRVPKKTFLALWALALVRLLVPFSVPSRLSVYTLLARPMPAAGVPAIASPSLLVLPLQPAVASQIATQTAETVSPWTVLWLAGAVLLAMVFAALYIRCCREFRMSLPVENGFARRWLENHPLRRPLALRQSDRIFSPLTFGVLRPVILMPKKTDWDDEMTLQYVLEHEFVHIQRFDTLFKLALIMAVCIHWFNPLAWVMYALANRDLELSCDETVVRRFGGARASYANVLIRMAEVKSGLTPLCNHFSKNAIEERITAIMKTKKTTIFSLILATVLVTGTVTVFATSAREDASAYVPITVGNAEATEGGINAAPDPELLAVGLTYRKNSWYYQGKAVAGMYDDNGGIYTDGAAADDIYLAIKRGGDGKITGLTPITKKQFTELVDRRMNDVGTEAEDGSLMSCVNPDDGRTYYSFDDGKTFEPMTDEEFEARFPMPDIEWWTYDEFKAWLDEEKAQLQGILGEKGWTGGEGSFIWTQKKIDETIALYESILADIKNGIMYSKTVDGRQDEVMMSYNPADISTSTDEKGLYIKLDNGEERTFGPYETDEELLAAVKPFCEEQVKLGNMKQSEADAILGRYTSGQKTSA